MSKLTELIDSLTNENADDLREALMAEATAREEKANQLYQRAKKAEGFEYNKDTKEWVKKEEKKVDTKPEAKEQKIGQSSEPDYAKLAFLNSLGVSHPDDQKVIQEEAARLQLPLTDVLGMEHIKTKLTANKDQREAQAGMPKGSGRSTGKTTADVDYHLAKGTTPDDLDLAEKVINARMAQEQKANKFSDELYTG